MIPDATPLSDAKLIRETQQGRPDALEALLERHLPALRVFVRLRLGRRLRTKESAMDVVQSVCRELLGHLDEFEYESDDRFRHWLYTAALNKLRQKERYYGAQRRDLAREAPAERESALVGAYDSVFTPSQNAMAREEETRLEAAFDRLPDNDREVITLAKVVRLPHEEIARTMGRTIPAVRNLLARALAKLSTALEEQPGE